MITITIYQINRERDSNQLAFRAWSKFERQGHKRPPAKFYDRVYSYQAETETLEGVFERFNLHRPADYTGRLLSPSDVVEFIWDTGEHNYYFRDIIGFKPVEFYSFLVGTENNFPNRLELLKADCDACEVLADELAFRIASDDHKPHRAIRDLIQAYTDKDPEGILIALSGWGLDSLIKLSKFPP